MKKSLLVLVALFTMILIPWKVQADDINVLVNTGDYKCKTETDVVQKKKITTCEIAVQNTTAQEFKGGAVTLTFEPKESSTKWEFTVKNAFEDSKAKTEKSVTLNIEPIAAKDTVVVGEVKWIADQSLSAADCGGNVVPTFKGSDTTGGNTGEGDVVDSGYAIPYVALALGAVGVVTVLATSKKKTKMYKI